MTRPNLFTYATSELSQDAFLCWLVAWAQCDSDRELQQCGRDFIAWLYMKSKSGAIGDQLDVELVDKPKKQYLNTDVYFQANISGKKVSFIIEDKTGTSHHSNQLELYPQRVMSDKNSEDELVCVYLKTGYWFPEDYLAKKYSSNYPYVQVTGADLLEFLGKYKESTANNILLDYYSELERKLSEIPQFVQSCDPVRDFDHTGNKGRAAILQCQFASRLVEKNTSELADSVSEEDVAHRVRHGANIGGSPWTQLDVFREKLVKDSEILEAVFYRIDFRVERGTGMRLPYICLRQWAPLRGKQSQVYNLSENKLSDLRLHKLKRLELYKDVVRSISSKLSHPLLSVDGVRVDRAGANESEIAILFLKSNKDVVKLMTELSYFHKEFVSACIELELVESEITSEESRVYKMKELKGGR